MAQLLAWAAPALPGAASRSAPCGARPLPQVLLRSWRQDADGTYIVLYQSTNHRKARQSKGGLLK